MFVFSNLATSLDGKIATRSKELFPLGTPFDRRQMIVLRKKCDAVLMGASTLRAWRRPCLAGKKRNQPWNIVLSSSLEGISPVWPFFRETQVRRILFVTRPIDARKKAAFQKTSEIIQLNRPSPKNPVAKQILRTLRSFGVKNLLLEGGGGVMWDFVSQNLIDELHLTLTPRLIGGTEAPTLVDGSGFRPREVVNLKLKRWTRKGNELYLTYGRTSHRGK